jgi:hypothetical protein
VTIPLSAEAEDGTRGGKVKKRLRKWWVVYCALVVVSMYGVCYFGSLALTFGSETGSRTLKSLVRELAEAAGGPR